MTSETLTAVQDRLQEISTNLFASAPQTLGFAPGMEVRSFLLRGPEENILLYGSEGALKSADAIDELGGAASLWLGHWHEAGLGAAGIAERFSVPVFVHDADSAETRKTVAEAETLAPGMIAPDIEAIHIPGHTPGSVAYLWNGPDVRCLFTADTLYVKDSKLRAGLLDSSDRQSFLASLSRLREVEFDLLVPWVAAKGVAPATTYEPAAFRHDLDAVIAWVEDGAAR